MRPIMNPEIDRAKQKIAEIKAKLAAADAASAGYYRTVLRGWEQYLRKLMEAERT